MRFLIQMAVVSALAISSAAHAANDGSMSKNGQTSQGDVTITAEVPLRTRISGLEDVQFGDLGLKDPDLYGDSDVNGTTDTQAVAVWSSSRAYTLTAAGDASDGFVIKTEDAESIAYSVLWQDSEAAEAIALDHGVTANNLVSNCKSVVCTAEGDTQAQLTIALDGQDIEEALVGSYTGVLTLTVQAQ